MQVARALVEHLLRVFVGEALVGVDDRLAEPLVEDIRFVVEREDGGDGETVFFRLERTEVVGKDLGKHRDCAINEIDARGALGGFCIERGAGLHEERDVGDVDADLYVSIGKLPYRERVVEVFCVERVDRAGANLSKVSARIARDPRRRFFRKYRGAALLQSLRIRDDTRREVRREPLAERERAHLGLVDARLADNLFDSTERVFLVRIPAHEPHERFTANQLRKVACPERSRGENDDRDVHLLVVGL